MLASKLFLIAIVLGASLAPIAVRYHRRGQRLLASAIDLVAIAWLFWLVKMTINGPPMLVGVWILLACIHVAGLIGFWDARHGKASHNDNL